MATLETPAPNPGPATGAGPGEPRTNRTSALTPSTTRCHRPDILAHAYARTRANGGAPGLRRGHPSRGDLHARGRELLLEELREELTTKTYRPGPARRAVHPKLNGGNARWGSPTFATVWSRQRSPCCWNRSLSGTPISLRFSTDSVRSALRTMPSTPSARHWKSGMVLDDRRPGPPPASIRFRTTA